MKKKYSIEGSYQINGNEEKKFEIEFDNLPENEEKNNKLLELLNKPWRLIKEGGKLGVNGVKRFLTVLFLFALSNTILFFYAISRLLSTDFEFTKIVIILLVLLIGLGITIYSAYRTYQYVIIDTMRVIYENLSSFFQKISELIIDKVENLFQGKVNLTDNQLKNALDFGKMVNSKYQKTPKFLRKGIILILNKIPFVGMLIDLKEDISKNNKLEASTKLYNKMDRFISDSIFGNNNTRWVWWLLPFNIIILLVLIKFKIG
ncbi:hypothetical protein FIA58_009950 [Flavobacterium jejuense]|uniref:SMODS and SLOG-associating 2TM effector domain-containing protein n=1 Tax=Flavobacterium jejuense TaxID=1544455 RepID=A0ABX0IS04_9FLAO|nr:hypothetical protein [Flavobacterium jejuense]NHN25996.1 hypothetical protein [Flavobacterium jejuense]